MAVADLDKDGTLDIIVNQWNATGKIIWYRMIPEGDLRKVLSY